MTKIAKIEALAKLAYFGPASVSGQPPYIAPPPTVGQALYSINGPYSVVPSSERRFVTDQIVGTGVDVNSPLRSLFRAGIGALAGNFLSNALGAGPFMRGISTAIGANYGYSS